MRAIPLIVVAASLAALASYAQRQNVPKIPPPGPSPTSGSDVGPFSTLPDNTAVPPPVIVGVEATPSPRNDALPNVGLRSTEAVQQATDETLDRAEAEHRRALARTNQAPVPIQGAFTGQTDERSR